MPNSHQNVQNLGASGMYGTNTNYGGGGVPVARSEMDFLRLGVGRAPQAEYPDGYLGTIRSRRDDRGRPSSTSDTVLNSLKVRVGQRSYERGVHRGERIDQSDYYYPAGLENTRGIARQMKASKDGNVYRSKRNVENAMAAPAPHLPNDGKANMRSTSPQALDKRRVDQMARMRPVWK
ncbi:hypothetical protein UFOVP696_75 [uncultured Caudovirales phage]|jgi:hypothetical protein|uniref:Uncharacterized protein n=1 Tax=uncultured Caudovirales phage TaxID=2100421 RepID=A0A6J5MLV6_9CAUD|nr:hypothetical protein UFOVP429_92 [uncultured Caudovirales phage]CAB4158207.1 hypothetical protein UFOVP696_75 [uncultured Caudovirales phage]